MNKVTTELFREYKSARSVKYSPDGSKAAFVVQNADNENDGYEYTIWLYENNNLKALTDMGKEGSFIWDDNNTLLFSSIRKESDKKRVEAGEEFSVFYRLSLDGGEALKAFTLPVRVASIEKMKNGKYVVIGDCDATIPDYYKMNKEERAKVHEDKKKNVDFNVLDESPFWMNGIPGFRNKRRNTLFVYEEDSDTLTRGCTPTFHVTSTTVIGDKIYAAGQDFTQALRDNNDVICFDTETKESKVIFKNTIFNNRHHQQMVGNINGSLIFTGDNDKIWGANAHPNFYTMNDNGELTLLCESDRSFYEMNSYEDCITICLSDRHGFNLEELKADGSWNKVTDWKGSISSFDFNGENYLFTGRGSKQWDELYCVDKDGNITQVSHFNDALMKDRYVGEPEYLCVPSHEWDVDGYVIKPIDFDENKSYPAILTIHGGPKGSYNASYAHEMQQWASDGYFVFYCNPLGSDGRGNKFAEIREKHGYEDYEDIMNFTDAVLAKYPQIDPKRMGVTGVSYGGYMTNWIIGHTDRFSAASSQCSVVNWISMYGVSDISMTFVPDQMNGSIYDKFETYWEHSPLKHACNAVTPTLFIQPMEDYRCHLSDGLQMATALMDKGVPTRIVTFAGDSHGLNAIGKPSHRERSFTETLNWMNKYLK